MQFAHLDGHPHLHFVKGDVHGLRRDARRRIDGCQIVIHCAAIAGVYSVDRNAVRTMEVNMLGTHQVVKAALDVGVERFVEFSTSEVYGAVHPQGQGRRPDDDRPDRREPLGLRRQQAGVRAPVVRALQGRRPAADDRPAVQRLRSAPGRRRRDPRHDAAGAAARADHALQRRHADSLVVLRRGFRRRRAALRREARKRSARRSTSAIRRARSPTSSWPT